MRGLALLAGLIVLASAAPAGARSRSYRVAAGDSVFTVAWQTGVAWGEIAAANGLDPATPPRTGQVLKIPPPGSVRAAAAPAVRFAWPLSGEVERGFSRSHEGIEIAATEGAQVRAAAAGRVIFAGIEPHQFGNLVVIDHGGGWFSAYGFLSRIEVREGEQVRAGKRLGRSGSTGMARGEQLHFEIRHDNRPVDPLPLLGER